MENKTYRIHIEGLNELQENMEMNLRDCSRETDPDSYDYWAGIIEFCKNNTDGFVEISTLEEYFNLLNKIAEWCQNEYSIYNNGTWIMLFD